MQHTAEKNIIGVRFTRVGKLYHFDASHEPDIKTGDRVIVQTRRGLQMGEVVRILDDTQDQHDRKTIERLASPRELVMQQEWQAQELPVLIGCREKAASHKQYRDVKFVKAEYNFDGTWLTIFYSYEGDGKVDTNAIFGAMRREHPGTHIEFRQIGPRDVAKLLGGYGACGIQRCCSTFLTEFSPISIRMAKEQGISLNPSEITGMCGRLRCCLIYEYEQYVTARKSLPKRNKKVGTPHGVGKVVDLLPLQDTAVVLVDDRRHNVHRDDIIPLAELEAMREKSGGGCSKRDGGGCDCRSRRPSDEEE